MTRDELALKLAELEPGECLSVPLYTLIAVFGSSGAVFDQDAKKETIAFSERYSCRLLYYEFDHREPDSADGERFVLVEGLHRVEACRSLGEETILAYLVQARRH